MNPNCIQEVLQVTPQANGLLFHALKDGNSAYHIAVWFEVDAEVTREGILAAWRAIQQAQPVLRSVFIWRGVRTPHQVIYELPRVVLEYTTAAASVDPESRTRRCAEWLASSKSRPFELDVEVFRIACFHDVAACTLRIAFSFHHILMDGWSSSLLISSWVQGLRGQKITAVPARSYAQQLWMGMSQQEQASARAYWQRVCELLPDGGQMAVTRLLAEPILRAAQRAPSQQQPADRIAVTAGWNDERTAAIGALCRRAGVTAASFVYLCWALTLAKLTFQRTIAFGCTFAGRGAALTLDLERQPLGLFTNTVPLVLALDGTWQVERALQQVFAAVRRVQQHEKTPPLLVRQALGLREELYDSIVVIDNYPIDATLQQADSGAWVTKVHSEETTHFGLTLSVAGQDRWQVELSAGETAGTDRAALQRVAAAFESIATQLLAAGDTTAIGDFEIKTGEIKTGEIRTGEIRTGEIRTGPHEQHRGSVVAGPSSVHAPDINGMLARIHQRLIEAADEIGLVDQGRRVSNRELSSGVCLLQQQLRAAGFLPGDRVAVHMEKGLAATQAILAILFSGGSYFYLSPKDPPSRRQDLLKRASCRMLVSSRALHGELGTLDERCPVLEYDALEHDADEMPRLSPGLPVPWSRRLPDEEFYLIFTSGTTGVPKGIAVRNESVANLLDWFVRETGLGPRDRVLALTDLNFDPSVEDLFGSLLAGATLVYPSPRVLLERQSFVSTLRAESISVVNFIPGAIAELAKDMPPLPHLRLWILGGEELPIRLRDELLRQGYAVRNHYGPSETTVDCLSAAQCLGTDVSLGWPIQNALAYCADVFGKPLPEGVRGELWIGGSGIAHGYATATASDRFVTSGDRRFYRTGDLVTFSRELGFRYHGRCDDQIKVNGVRIEARELELAVEALADVHACCLLPVIAHGKRTWRLFVDSKGAPALVESRVRAHLRQHFAEAWLPALIVVLDGFERTPIGKIDRVRLEQRANEILQQQVVLRQSVATDPVELKVHAVWSSVLECEVPANDVNFFDAGGNSLKIVSLQAQLQQVFGHEISIAVLFEYPTIASFAAWIKQCEADDQHVEASREQMGTPRSEPLAEVARSGRGRLAERRNRVKETSAS